MWETVDIAGKDKAIILLASILLNTKSTSALIEALEGDYIQSFRGAIPRHEETRHWYGHTPQGSPHGYESVERRILQGNVA